MRPNEDKMGTRPSSNFINERSLGINISLSLNLLKDVDDKAREEGLSRSALVRRAILVYLKK